MKKLLIIFILFANYAEAQTSGLDSAIQKNIRQMFVGADTSYAVYTVSKSGSFNFDTLRCATNTVKRFQLNIGGFAKTKKVYANADIWVSNTDGVYAIEGSPLVTSSLGLGSNLLITKTGNFIIVRLSMANTILFNWTLKKQ